jgi:hypothetical protein
LDARFWQECLTSLLFDEIALLNLNNERTMLDFKLPDYEVLIHIKYNEFGKKLVDKILAETVSYVLDESTEYQGVIDFHWAFESWDDAVQAGELLKKFCPNPNLLLLKIKANYNEGIKPIIHKDLIRTK